MKINKKIVATLLVPLCAVAVWAATSALVYDTSTRNTGPTNINLFVASVTVQSNITAGSAAISGPGTAASFTGTNSGTFGNLTVNSNATVVGSVAAATVKGTNLAVLGQVYGVRSFLSISSSNTITPTVATNTGGNHFMVYLTTNVTLYPPSGAINDTNYWQSFTIDWLQQGSNQFTVTLNGCYRTPGGPWLMSTASNAMDRTVFESSAFVATNWWLTPVQNFGSY